MFSKVRLALILTFLTLVSVQPCWGASDSRQSPREIDTRPLSPNDTLGAKLVPYRKDSKKTLTATLGGVSGALVDESEIRSSRFLGFSQTNYNHDMTAQNFGFELLENGQVGAHLGFRKSIKWGEWFEPYYQWGVGSLFKTSEGPASLINYQRYQARLHFGFEDLFHFKRNLRADIGIAQSPIGFSYQYSIGYVFED